MSVTPKSGPRSPPGAEIPTGTVLGSYRVLSELGRGGMGVVYRAEDLERGGTVALKTLLWGDPAAVLRFKQEFRSIADITHPNLATLFELVSERERLFFTMELVEGVNFGEWVKADPARLRPALAQLARGLHALHGAGRIHRDVKPSNVRVARDGRVVILDFGLAATLGKDGAHRSTVLAARGTPAYMAPEQAQGKPVTAACDWYGVGVMLYEALAGRLPFEGAGVDVLVAKQMGAPRPVSDIAPDVPEDLASLCMALLQPAPERRPQGAEVLERLHAEQAAVTRSAEIAAEGTPGIVGRADHLRALRDAFESLRERCPVMVFVHGYSGMGKTTLVQSFQEELSGSRGAVVLHGKCYERESVPYKALDGPIDALTRYLSRLPRLEVEALLPRDVHSIARVFPVLRRVEAIAQAPPPKIEIPDPQEVRRRAFAGLREVFARISDRVPLVVCVDDLQWGDTDSADLLANLLRPPEAPVFLFVGCYRREDADTSAFLQSIRQGRELPEAREIRVDPLSRDEATELATTLGVAADRAATIVRESGGSPFFLQELVAYGGAADTVTLEEVLHRRISSLPAGAAALLEVVAIAGGPVPRATAAFAARLGEGAPSSLMAALRSNRLVRVTSSETGEELDTYHDRVRETVVAGLPEQRGRELHRRLGHALEVEPDVDPEVLGLHFEGAGDALRAGAHYARAGASAHRALAFDHAVQLYRKALALLSPTGEKRRDLLRRVADALGDGGRCAEAGSVYLEAAEGALGVELRARAARQLLVSGHLDEGERVADPIERELRIRLPKSMLLTVLGVVRDVVWIRLRGLGFRKRDPATIPRADILRLEVLNARVNYLSAAHPGRGLPYVTREVLLATKLGNPASVAIAVAKLSAYEFCTGLSSRHRFERLLRISAELAEESGSPLARGYLDLASGMAHYVRGNWSAGREALGNAARRFREECVGSWFERHYAECYTVICLDLQGKLRELRADGIRLVRDAEDRGHLFMETDLRLRVIHLTDLMRDAPAEAQEGLGRASARWPMDRWSFQRYRWIDSTVQVGLYRDDPTEARVFFARQWSSFRRSFLARVPSIRNFMVFDRDRLALTEVAEVPPSGRTRERLSTLARIGGDLLKSPDTYAQGWGWLVRGGVANLTGDAEAALRHLETAEAKFTEAQMGAYRAVTRRRRGELIGGDEGRELIAESDAWLEGQAVRNPTAWARMYAPGFEERT